MKTRYLPWLLGTAVLATLIAIALHVSEAEAFARLIEDAQPAWLTVAFGLQAATYLAQGQIWRSVTRAAGAGLSIGAAYRLSLIKLLVDQALPSSGLSGALVVAGALRRRGIAEDVTTSGIVVSSCAYLFAYVIALGTGLGTMIVHGHVDAPVVVGAAVFILVAVAVAASAIFFSGKNVESLRPRKHWFKWLQASLDMLRRARPELARNPRLLVEATAMQLVIVALDCLTVWVLIRAVGANAPVSAVFTSFMVSTLLRTISIVPGGLGTFEAVLVFTLHNAGVAVPVALSATLLFRLLSFWLPMLPGFVLSRSVLREK